ncbi:GUN4 domain-containing protein [Halomicronema hongdechloris C2206]|uniref:GUN4 domain-containing protein n=1 Tax=Halomicronema hongdechloris C2206 TaxID=1641165 RepID=A0A1Z3HIZ9_9CYAN|nr:GUN4 domain-containing protein [Halomicronema hongdechloris]ASC70236.1 GUN4 domain-containing protein [Halomicronema hongdechloris C2206]
MSRFTSPSSAAAEFQPLQEQLQGGSTKQQLQAIEELAVAGETGLQILWECLLERRQAAPTVSDGRMIQVIYAADHKPLIQEVERCWPRGRLPMPSAQGIDYHPLQQYLVAQAFEEADRLTLKKLCELAGPTAVQRNWLYFTEVEGFPVEDLLTLDRLWQLYSLGKFGFSQQRQIWLGAGRNWDVLWERIAWKREGRWTRYPGEFIWDLTAPRGHLPLSNQLRGVRAIASLLNHPAWTQETT